MLAVILGGRFHSTRYGSPPIAVPPFLRRDEIWGDREGLHSRARQIECDERWGDDNVRGPAAVAGRCKRAASWVHAVQRMQLRTRRQLPERISASVDTGTRLCEEHQDEVAAPTEER